VNHDVVESSVIVEIDGQDMGVTMPGERPSVRVFSGQLRTVDPLSLPGLGNE
jgi:hypothetical protein